MHKNPGTRIELALELHRRQKASLAKYAEIAGVTTIEFKEILADRGIKREIDVYAAYQEAAPNAFTPADAEYRILQRNYSSPEFS